MKRTLARLVWLPIALQFLACTAGVVIQDGSPVEGSTVEIRTCQSVAGTYVTTTDSGGGFRFNPYDPESANFDGSEHIEFGPIAILVTGDDGSTVARRDHQYTENCPLTFAGSVQTTPCAFHVVDLVPMSMSEFTEEVMTFYEEDCGHSARVATALGATALVPASPANPLVGAFDLAGTRGSQVSCIAECTFSCSGQKPADFRPCMCLCVESNCGASFGPFCTEASP